MIIGAGFPVAAVLRDGGGDSEAEACFLDITSPRTGTNSCTAGDVSLQTVDEVDPVPEPGTVSLGPDPSPPPAKPSFYVPVHDPDWAREAGCEMGRQDVAHPGAQATVMVMAFGQTEAGPNGGYRLSYFHGPDRAFGSAREMAVALGQGYHECTAEDPSSRLWIAIGTNNYPDSAVERRAGATLAVTARTAAEELEGTRATAWGGNDFEAWGIGEPSLNQRSREWLDGYNAVRDRPPLVNFGSADACTIRSMPGPHSCHPGLTAETIVYVSTQGAARALPEIYTPSGTQAAQWKHLARYAAKHTDTPMRFPGVMAQHGACGQRGGCEDIDNDTDTAWTQLNDELDRNPSTATDPGAPTDIYWQDDLMRSGWP